MSLIGEINKKHVMLSMANGCVLEGFVEHIAGEYLTLIETNNQKVIVKIGDISFVRFGVAVSPSFKPVVEPRLSNEESSQYYKPSEETVSSKATEEYCMQLPKSGDLFPRPELSRRSRK